MQDATPDHVPVETILSDYTLDLAGHMDTDAPRPVASLARFQHQQLRDHLERLARFTRRVPDSEMRVQVGNCPGCGLMITARIDQAEQVLRYDHSLGYDGRRSITLMEPCRHPVPTPYHSDLQVPSGQLVIANDLRQIISPDTSHCAVQETAYSLAQRGHDILVSCDSRDACRLYHEFWRTRGLSYLPASNTSVTVVRDTATDALDVLLGSEPTGQHEVLGNIITDLWAVCLMDRRLFDRYCQASEIDAQAWRQAQGALVVDVPRGPHRLTLLHEMIRPSDDAAMIARLRPDPEQRPSR